LKRPNVTFAASAASPKQFPRDGLPEVAFLGRSNVGKSSLLNALAGTKNLARVSSQPGRTQSVNFFRVEHDMYFVDLPGYGYAKVPHAVRETWEGLVTGYLLERKPLALCVFLIDARHDPMANDLQLNEFLEHNGLPWVLAATKADKLGRGERRRRELALSRGLGRGARAVVSVSAVERDGVAALWREIRRAAAEHLEESHGH
jgi:GTP-binding protein